MPLPLSKKGKKPAPTAAPKQTAKAIPKLTAKATPKTARNSTKKPVIDDPTKSECESLLSKKPRAQKVTKQLVVTTDDDLAAESDTETPQLPHKMVKEVEQEKTGRKKKECIRDAIEAIQIAKVSTSKGENRVVESPPLGKPNCLGDSPQWRRIAVEGREEAAVDQSNRASMKRSNRHVEDINIDQPDMVTR